jgi:hypothetical protein
MFDLRLIGAEALKLRKRRGMVALAIALTAGVAVLVFAVTGIQHATNPGKYGPAGGLVHYRDAVGFLTLMILVVGAIVGSTAGSADLESGVFRDLAATGRSRIALFGSRIPGAWAIVLPIAAGAAAIAAVASVTLAGSLAAPTAGAVIAGTAALMLAGALGSALAVGLAALFGSRGAVIATLLAFELAISPILGALSFLGGARQVLPGEALDRIAQISQHAVPIALPIALLVIAVWMAAAFSVGAWRTKTHEI